MPDNGCEKMTKKKVVAIISAIVIILGLALVHIWLKNIYDSNYFDAYEYRQIIFLEYTLLFGPAFLIGAIIAFFTNLVFPVATSRQSAIQYAKPSLFLFLSYMVVFEVITSTFDPVYRTFEAIWFTIMGFCFIYIPMSVLLMVVVAFFGWLGARIRMGTGSQSAGESL